MAAHLSGMNAPLDPSASSLPALGADSVPDSTGQHRVEKATPSQPGDALAAQIDTGRSKLEKLLALVPLEKQAEAGGLVIDIIKEAQDVAPPDRRPSKLAIGRGVRWRKSERAPLGEKGDHGPRA